MAVVLVTGNLLSVLGLQPIAGRDFLAEEDQPGHATAMLISHGLWEQNYAGRPDAIGGTLTLDGVAHTIVGAERMDSVRLERLVQAGIHALSGLEAHRQCLC